MATGTIGDGFDGRSIQLLPEGGDATKDQTDRRPKD